MAKSITVERLERGPSTQAWRRAGDHDELLGVSVTRDGDGSDWYVWVDAAARIREQPLESQLRSAVMRALGAVDGVEGAEEEDREVWLVWGDVTGPQLVEAVANALDTLAPLLLASRS